MIKREDISKYLSCASIVVLVSLFSSMNPNFISAYNIKNILNDASPLLAMSCGVTFTLMLGSIDLSIGAIASCSAVMLTLMLERTGVFAYLIVLSFGLFAGLLNGILHTKLRVPSFIATLSTQSIWQSAALLLSGGMPLTMLPKTWGYVNWTRSGISVFPSMFIAAMVFMVVCYILQSQTIMGKSISSTGYNERAARLIGLNVQKAKITAFVMSGLGAAIGGIFFAVKLKSGIPTVGEQYTLIAIASAVLGGIALTGGRGSVLMSILGVGLITVIQNGMNVVAVDGFWQQIVFGMIVLCAIYMNTDRSRRDSLVK